MGSNPTSSAILTNLNPWRLLAIKACRWFYKLHNIIHFLSPPLYGTAFNSSSLDEMVPFWEDEKYIEFANHAFDVHQTNMPIKNILFYPFFMGNPESEESLSLRTEFLQAREKIIDYFEGKDFLETTLSLLAKP